MAGICRVGVSGWVYPPWRGGFYPPKLPHRNELSFLSSQLASVEINGSFYALQRPTSYQHWYAQTPDDFVFSVKAPRFITHMKRLLDADVAVANFFASGILALGDKLGAILWQLPPNLPFDPERLGAFFARLPRSTAEAAWTARHHDERLAGRALTVTNADRPMRHALEVRHASYLTPAFTEVLREHHVAIVVADTAGKWPLIKEVTADFAYVRLHGDQELYASGYTADALDGWATLIAEWARTGHDAYVYFDNDVKVRAPFDAMSLADRLADLTPRRRPSAASR